MNKIEILYNKILILLEPLNLDIIPDNWDEGKEENVIVILENIETEVDNITNCKNQKSYFQEIDPLKENIELILQEVVNIQGFKKSELYFHLLILSKISLEYQDSDQNLEENVANDFSIIQIDDEINMSTFIHTESDINKTILLFSLTDESVLINFINSINNIDILFHLLQALLSEEIDPTKKYILVNSNHQEKKEMVCSTLSLYILQEGNSVHHSHEYNENPSITSSCQINLGEAYHQFNDSIDILSEYNKSNDLLNKYLRIYHIMENFMYKSSLVKLERNNNSEPFSVRDFQRMFSAIDTSEIMALTNLMKDILDLEYSATQKFNTFILDKWTKLVTGTNPLSETQINTFLRLLDLRTKNKNELNYNQVQDSNLFWAIGNLIYKYRNSFVHNRETEFHLTNNTLIKYPMAKEILTRFLIPVLEEIVFHLIFKKNDVVWYQNSSLKLWKD